MSKLIDLKGQRFGKLVVIKRESDILRADGKYIPAWLCECDCGGITTVAGFSLRNGRTQSCGCSKRIHGESYTNGSRKPSRLYRIWIDIKGRCFYPSCKSSYPAYGARGITMCDEWRNSFVSFRDWAMKNGYTDFLSIDRIDNNGDYEPTNCRWVTASEQRLNQRQNRQRNALGQYC